MNVTTRSAIVTGASSGIGLAIAEMLRAEGFALTVVARDAVKMQSALHSLNLVAGPKISAITGSVADEVFLDEVVYAHSRMHGALDILVNNAGVAGNRRVGDVDASFVDGQWAVNARAVVLLTSKCLVLLKEAVQRHGSAQVVSISSNAGKRGEATLSTYSATKAAVIGFTQALHDELATSGIRATAICPGMVDTPMTDHYKDVVPASQMISPRDVAEVVRMTTRLSPACIIPEVIMLRPTEWLERRPETNSFDG